MALGFFTNVIFSVLLHQKSLSTCMSPFQFPLQFSRLLGYDLHPNVNEIQRLFFVILSFYLGSVSFVHKLPIIRLDIYLK